MITFQLFSILLAAMIAFLGYGLSLVFFEYRNFTVLSDYVPMVIGMAFGAGAYYLINLIMQRRRANNEKMARESLEPYVPPGETLRAFTFGRAYDARPWRIIARTLRDAISGNPRRIYYYVGVTDQSLIIVWSDGNMPDVTEYVLPRREVKQVRFDNILISGPRLLIKFTAEPMIFWIEGDHTMVRRARELAIVWNGGQPSIPRS